MKQVLWHLFTDFLPAILFLIVYAASGSVRVAAGIALAAGLAQLAWIKLANRQIEPMQWMSVGLVVALGSATTPTLSSGRFCAVASRSRQPSGS